MPTTPNEWSKYLDLNEVSTSKTVTCHVKGMGQITAGIVDY